jgi:hypothetical protein
MNKFKLSLILFLIGLFMSLTVNFHLFILAKIIRFSDSQVIDLLPAFKTYVFGVNILSFILVFVAVINAVIVYNNVTKKLYKLN